MSNFKSNTEIMNTRASERILKTLGDDMKQEMDTLTADELKQVLVTAHDSMKQAKEKLESNSAYQQAKEDVSHFTSGKRAVDKFQKAKIEYACARLDDMGKLVMHDRISLEVALQTAKRTLAKTRAERLETESKSGPVYSICLSCNKRKPCVCETCLPGSEVNAEDSVMANTTVQLNDGPVLPFSQLAKALREA